MFTTTMRSLSAVLALGLILSLTAPSQAAPLNGLYWADDTVNGSTTTFYYAPFVGTGLGNAVSLGTISIGQVTDMKVATVGGTDYLYWTGCCGGDSNTYAAPFTSGTTVNYAAKVQVNNQSNNPFAIDPNATTPQMYYSDGNTNLYQSNADGSNKNSPTTIDTYGGTQIDGVSIYKSGANTHLLIGTHGSNIYDYSFTTGSTPTSGTETILTSDASGGVDDLEYDPSTGTLYYVNNYSGLAMYNGGTTTSLNSGPNGGEIKEIAYDPVSNRLYFAGQENSLEYNDLSGGAGTVQTVTPANDPTLVSTFAIFVVDQAEAPSGVPEPSTFALAALGLAGLGLVAWRKRRQK